MRTTKTQQPVKMYSGSLVIAPCQPSFTQRLHQEFDNLLYFMFNLIHLYCTVMF